ncbi:hypothetical protein EVAR_14869_1 [Eumeta japonica]|uniref:Uncharacterized protein n=1 Tax=Eumeta variegata TaxID=151549 RepID=A0A4C1V300_EUMVA|nr:hypothetical protein EVAR_14869_1 [Eumeta japonica]
MEDAERQGYEVLGPDTPTHVPTDIRHRPDVLDIVIGHKIRRSMHVEVMYGMDTQHLPILVTVGSGTSTRHRYLRDNADWKLFESSLETLHLVPPLRPPPTSRRLPTTGEKIKRHRPGHDSLPISTSRRGDLP